MVQYWLLSYPRKNVEITIQEKLIGGRSKPNYENLYRSRIDKGDKIVLYISGDCVIKGSATVVGNYYFDESVVWPPRKGEVWPHRRRIEVDLVYDLEEEQAIQNYYPELNILEKARKEKKDIGKAFGRIVSGLTPILITEHDYLLLTNQLETDVSREEISYFIFRTGGGGYEDVPPKEYHFVEGIPGSRQVLEAEKNGEFVYYELERGGFWARGKIGRIRRERREGVTHFFIAVEDFQEIGPISFDSVKGKLSFVVIGQGGMKKISEDDYNLIIGYKPHILTLLEKISVAHLLSGKNLVLYGPPGTGKTRLAEKLALAFCGNQYTLVTANAEWSTYNVVGGDYITGQDSEQGGLRTTFRAGFLSRAASEGRVKPYWIIIDELNRANLDLAFGEAFTLLDIEYRENVPLVRERDYPNSSLEGDCFLPSSFRLIATMNSYDRAALFSLGYAFRRRFAFVEVASPYREIEEIKSSEIRNLNWQDLIAEEDETYQSVKNEVSKWIGQQLEPPLIDPDRRIKNLDSFKNRLSQAFTALETEPFNIFRLFDYLSRWITHQNIVDIGYAQTVDAIKFVLAYTCLQESPLSQIIEAADYAFLSYYLPHLEYFLPKARREKIGGSSGEVKSLEKLETLETILMENGLRMSSNRLREIRIKLEQFAEISVLG